jgi:hypothetical protein
LAEVLERMIEQEIEVLINFDVNHMNKIDKEMIDQRVKGLRAFQLKVLNEENNR